MNKPIHIRDFEDQDLEILHKIREAAFRNIFMGFREQLGSEISPYALASAEKEQEELLNKLCQSDTPDKVYVAIMDDVILGFVSIQLDETTKTGELGLNAVHPDYVSKGIGTKLYEFALEKMKECGMAIAVVGTANDKGHAPARRAYEKAGFGPALHSIWLYKKL